MNGNFATELLIALLIFKDEVRLQKKVLVPCLYSLTHTLSHTLYLCVCGHYPVSSDILRPACWFISKVFAHKTLRIDYPLQSKIQIILREPRAIQLQQGFLASTRKTLVVKKISIVNPNHSGGILSMPCKNWCANHNK